MDVWLHNREELIGGHLFDLSHFSLINILEKSKRVSLSQAQLFGIFVQSEVDFRIFLLDLLKCSIDIYVVSSAKFEQEVYFSTCKRILGLFKFIPQLQQPAVSC